MARALAQEGIFDAYRDHTESQTAEVAAAVSRNALQRFQDPFR